MLRILTPHHRIASVNELTPDRLRVLGIESLLLDADGTLKRYTSDECAPGVAEWLESLKQARIGLCIVSNGLGERIGRFAEKTGLPFVPKAIKPLPAGMQASDTKDGLSSRIYRYGGGSALCRRDCRPAGRPDNFSRRADPSRGRAVVYAAQAAAGAVAAGEVGPFCRKGPLAVGCVERIAAEMVGFARSPTVLKRHAVVLGDSRNAPCSGEFRAPPTLSLSWKPAALVLSGRKDL